jgi:2-polyprenyl-6-methoxyphenol hydroxylase-like FAD-dependent oxidoreductase
MCTGRHPEDDCARLFLSSTFGLNNIMVSIDSNALIVGGGLAGLALGRQLHTAGIDCAVLEKRPAFAAEGFAINLPGNAIAALAHMGLGEQIAAIGCPTRRREYRNHRGRLLFDIDEDAFWGPAQRPRCVRRTDLMALLRDGLPASMFHMAAGVAGMSSDADGITVTTTGGQAFHGRLVIGADGVHSRVRDLAFDEAPVRAALLSPSSWRFVAPNPGIDCWTVWAGPGALFLLIPLGKGEVYGWARVNRMARGAAPEDGFAAAFDRFPHEVRSTAAYLAALPGSLHRSPLEEVRLPAWTRDRVVLVGDAAHATAPVWAQGGALAFEDAVTLANVLHGTADWTQAGARFEALRRPRVSHVQAMTDKMSRAARLPAAIRDLLLSFVGPRTYVATYGPLRR